MKMQKWLSNHILIAWFGFQRFMCYGDQEIEERGKAQYQLLKERGNLPQYGYCWKSGVEYLERGCKHLTEEIQSEIALHFTNCFLAMSGHDTYNCQLDKKPNLRAICVNSMSDRAFNVYAEFYTHTQNMCGFLQGHVWQEIIAESTMVVGKKLKETVQNQEGLLEAQKESLKLQERMLQHGRVLENVLDDLFVSFKDHQDILNILSRTVSNLQDWIVSEMSWFDSLLFYTVSVILVFILTSSYRTSSARLLIFFLLFLNFLMERLICSIYIFISDEDSSNMYSKVYNYIWFFRYGFMLFSAFVLVYFAFVHKDYCKKQYEILCSIQEQNLNILKILQSSTKLFNNNSDQADKVYLNSVNETIRSVNNDAFKSSKNSKNISNEVQQEYLKEMNNSTKSVKTEAINSKINQTLNTFNNLTPTRSKLNMSGHNNEQLNKNYETSGDKYNLRKNRCVLSEPKIK